MKWILLIVASIVLFSACADKITNVKQEITQIIREDAPKPNAVMCFRGEWKTLYINNKWHACAPSGEWMDVFKGDSIMVILRASTIFIFDTVITADTTIINW